MLRAGSRGQSRGVLSALFTLFHLLHGERERETHAQIDRHTDRQIDRQTDTQIDTDRQRQRQRHREGRSDLAGGKVRGLRGHMSSTRV